MNTQLGKASLVAGCLILASITQAHAEQTTLQRIDADGVISLGHRESSIPFSYYDDKQNVIGYSHEMALKIVDAVKTKLNKPDLKVKLTPVT